MASTDAWNSVDDHTLNEEDDFMDVKEAVQEVLHRWRFIGGALGLRPAQIQTIQATHRGSVEDSMDDAILVWLRRAHNEKRHGPPTWRNLVRAIAARAGGQNVAHARTVAEAHHPTETTTVSDAESTNPQSASAATAMISVGGTVCSVPDITTGKPQAVPQLIRYMIESEGEAVSVEAYGLAMKRFPAHELAKKATSVEFSFGVVQVKEDLRQKVFESYTMQRSPHGLCVIINNERFSEHTERTGTQMDEVNLTQCFRYLGYTVEVHRNRTAHQIEAIFSYYRSCDHARFDSFVVCILSHGDDGHVFGTDSKSVELQAIVGKLNAETCTSLAGKPKVFFIQACRGGDRVHGAQIKSDSGTPEATVLRSSEAVKVITDSSSITIPDDADFFFGNATPPGKVAWRDLDHGSWYVSEICRSMCSHARYADLVTMVTEVHNEVGTRYDNQNFRQAPEATIRLRKKVYFFD